MEKTLKFEGYIDRVEPSMSHPGQTKLIIEGDAGWTIPVNPLEKRTALLAGKKVKIAMDVTGKIKKVLEMNRIGNKYSQIYPVSIGEKKRIAALLEDDENVQSMYQNKKLQTEDYLAVFGTWINNTTINYTIQQMADIEFAYVIMDLHYTNKYIVESDYITRREEGTIPPDQGYERMLVEAYAKYMEIAQYAPYAHSYEEFLFAVKEY